jgi:hypothetical protein
VDQGFIQIKDQGFLALIFFILLQVEFHRGDCGFRWFLYIFHKMDLLQHLVEMVTPSFRLRLGALESLYHFGYIVKVIPFKLL